MMFHNERTYYFILGALIVIFVLVEALKPKPLDWTESFSNNDTIPYGGYLLHEMLPTAFPDDSISVNRAPIFEYSDTANAQKNWIFINRSFGLDPYETEILLGQVEKGARVFIAARTFNQALADSLNLGTRLNNPFLGGGIILDEDSVLVNFTNPKLASENGYPYQRSTTETYFSSFDSSHTVRLLGINNEENPNFIQMNFGKGELFLHTNPTLFTNYFVRNKTGADYALTALSYLPERATVWDEYYKDVRSSGGSVVRYVVSQEHLRWAWILSLSGVVLFIIFRAKRRQRIIPKITPPKNSSIEFAKTIGDLYREKGDHKLIVDKKISFFFDYIRTNLNLDADIPNQELIQHVANRSGIQKNEIEAIFNLINILSQKEEISTRELKLLTDRIDQFYNLSQR